MESVIEKRESEIYSSKVNTFRYWAVAASLLFVAGLGSFFVFNDTDIPQESITSRAENEYTNETGQDRTIFKSDDRNNESITDESIQTSIDKTADRDIPASMTSDDMDGENDDANFNHSEFIQNTLEKPAHSIATITKNHSVSNKNLKLSPDDLTNYNLLALKVEFVIDDTSGIGESSFKSKSTKYLAVNERTSSDKLSLSGISFSFTPLFKYNILNPVRNNILFIESFNSPSAFDNKRFGFQTDFTLNLQWNERFSFYSGISFQRQRRFLQFDATNLISQQRENVVLDQMQQIFGLHVGFKKSHIFHRVFTSYFVIGGEYQHIFSSGREFQKDFFTINLGYELMYSNNKNIPDFSITPMIKYSFNEISSFNLSEKPYWVGLKFSFYPFNLLNN